jgi:anti-sigma factor RsiW
VSADEDDPPLAERDRLLTAWVDGALSPQEHAEFTRLCAQDRELAAAASRHKELFDLSRSLQLQEPTDHETRRFWGRFYNRGEWQLGWCLLIGGALLLLAFAIEQLLVGGLPVTVKVGACAVLAGGAILLWNTARLKMRTSRFDRYRGVLY